MSKLPFTLTTKTIGSDSWGQHQETDVSSGLVWGNLKPATGAEAEDFGQVSNTVTHVMECRYQSNLINNCRLTYNSRTFEIVSVLNLEERNREMKLALTEILTT